MEPTHLRSGSDGFASFLRGHYQPLRLPWQVNGDFISSPLSSRLLYDRTGQMPQAYSNLMKQRRALGEDCIHLPHSTTLFQFAQLLQFAKSGNLQSILIDP